MMERKKFSKKHGYYKPILKKKKKKKRNVKPLLCAPMQIISRNYVYRELHPPTQLSNARFFLF